MEPILWLKVFLAQWQGQKPGGPPQHSLVGMLISLWAPGPQRPLSAGKALFLAHRTQGIYPRPVWLAQMPHCLVLPSLVLLSSEGSIQTTNPTVLCGQAARWGRGACTLGAGMPRSRGGWLCLWLNLTLKACS